VRGAPAAGKKTRFRLLNRILPYETAINCDKDIEILRGERKQGTVFTAAPIGVAHRRHGVVRVCHPHATMNALV